MVTSRPAEMSKNVGINSYMEIAKPLVAWSVIIFPDNPDGFF